MAADESGGGPDDHELTRLLRQLTVETDRFAEIFGQANGLHRTDLNALAVIMDASQGGRPLSPSQLAAALHLSASATTSVLDRLEAAGHIRRAHSQRDRRRTDLVIDERALAIGHRFFAPLGAELAAVWAAFTERERAAIRRFLLASIEATVRVRGRVADQG